MSSHEVVGLVETGLRVLVAVGATIVSVELLRVLQIHHLPARPIMVFLAGVVLVITVWRWAILWFDIQDTYGDLGWLEQWVRPINAALLFLVLVGVGLLAYFHSRRSMRGG